MKSDKFSKNIIDKVFGEKLKYTKHEFNKVFEALRRAYFLIEKNGIKDEYFEALRIGLNGLLPSQICQLEKFIKTGEIKMTKRTMIYVEYPLAKSLQEAIECIENGGSAQQECSDDFPNCGGFDTVDELLYNFPIEEFEDDENFEGMSIHLIPKGEENKEAKPFELGEDVWARKDFTDNTCKGMAFTIIEISEDGKIRIDSEDLPNKWFEPNDFCRCE